MASKEPFSLTIARHGVLAGDRNPFKDLPIGQELRLTHFQVDLLEHERPIRIGSAPTGAGKTFAFELAPLLGLNILFIVPTRRLAQNLHTSVRDTMREHGWDDAEIDRRLAIWTSDASLEKQATGASSSEIRQERVRQIRGQRGFRETGTFIIATPESVALLLLCPPSNEHGQPTTSLADLLSRDHIVFDEFHTIEAQGFGLAAAVCKLTSGLAEEAAGGIRPKVTFLSATPIGIRTILESLDVPAEEVVVLTEDVHSWPVGIEPAHGRIIHGDVTLEVGRYKDIVEACRGEERAIQACLEAGQTVIVISDSVAQLEGKRDNLAPIFESYGVDRKEILTINSIADSHREAADEYGIFGRTQDPRRARVILATSSIEMGVTFAASLMIMDPGYDICSFIQRLGRVSRGDRRGRVVVTSHGRGEATLRRLHGFLRDQTSLRMAPIDINTFIAAVLANQTKALSTVSGPDLPEIRLFSTLSIRATWCAALFWCALRRVWSLHKGEKATLDDHAPRKSWVIESKLKELENSRLEAPKAWVQALIQEARSLRSIEPSIRVKYSDRTDEIPESLAARHEAIARAPVLEDDKGPFRYLSRPLAAILRDGSTLRYRPTIDPLPPLDGCSIGTLDATSDAAAVWVQRVKRAHHPFGLAGDAVLDTCASLVAMTRIIPSMDTDASVCGGDRIV